MWIGIFVGVINGVVVHTHREAMPYTVAFLPFAGGVLYGIINGDIENVFKDFTGSLMSLFFLGGVGILFVSILAMLPVGILLHFFLQG
jgi:hypothetical protein